MSTAMIILIVYLIGYVGAYYTMRWIKNGHKSWMEILESMWVSLLSWVAILIAIIVNNTDKKPPKWL